MNVTKQAAMMPRSPHSRQAKLSREKTSSLSQEPTLMLHLCQNSAMLRLRKGASKLGRKVIPRIQAPATAMSTPPERRNQASKAKLQQRA